MAFLLSSNPVAKKGEDKPQVVEILPATGAEKPPKKDVGTHKAGSGWGTTCTKFRYYKPQKLRSSPISRLILEF